MEQTQYETRIVTILDALAKQDLGDEDSSKFVQSLQLLLKDVSTNYIFQAELGEQDVREIFGIKDIPTTKQMIDLAIVLRQREEPVKLMVPVNTNGSLTAKDVMKSDRPAPTQAKKKKKRYYANKKNNGSAPRIVK